MSDEMILSMTVVALTAVCASGGLIVACASLIGWLGSYKGTKKRKRR
jgi:hypothetical protein